MTSIDRFINDLSLNNQSHVLRHVETLTADEKILLSNQLVIFSPMSKICTDFKKANESHSSSTEELHSTIHKIPDEIYSSAKQCDQNVLDNYWTIGLEAISKCEVAIILMAGGQGTRLGFSYPKGMYNVGLPSQKSLFQLQAERILRLQHLAKQSYPDSNPIMPWYIMTSDTTYEATRDFFNANSNFGLESKQIMFFVQGVMPCFEFDGKMILDSPYHIATAPDGNGGMYKALDKFGCLENMRQQKIKYLHAYCVDNILVRVADPVFIGYCIFNNADCGNKVVEKRSADEAVGVVCKVDNVGYSVIEYSEMPKELNEARNANGQLVYRAGNIANHFFSFEFLTEVCTKYTDELVYHVAKKKIPYMDESGKLLKPTILNGIKLEKFVFDVFPFAKRFFVWEVEREDEFSPLKNADGCDSPATCCADVYRLHRRWLQKHGVDLDVYKRISQLDNVDQQQEEKDGQKAPPSTPFEQEISPLITYRGEDLTSYVTNNKELQALLDENTHKK